MSLLIILGLMGFIVWVIVTYLPMPIAFRRIVIVIASIVMAIFCLETLGLVPPPRPVLTPQHRQQYYFDPEFASGMFIFTVCVFLITVILRKLAFWGIARLERPMLAREGVGAYRSQLVTKPAGWSRTRGFLEFAGLLVFPVCVGSLLGISISLFFLTGVTAWTLPVFGAVIGWSMRFFHRR